MTADDRPLQVRRVPCEICRKEVPESEAVVPEAIDYILYFCGFDCYEVWRSRGATPEDRLGAPDIPRRR